MGFNDRNNMQKDNWDRRVSLIPYTVEELEELIQRCIERALKGRSTSGVDERDEILDCNTVCREFHISLPTLIKYRVEGCIPFFRIGNRIKFRRSELRRAFERIGWEKDGK